MGGILGPQSETNLHPGYWKMRSNHSQGSSARCFLRCCQYCNKQERHSSCLHGASRRWKGTDCPRNPLNRVIARSQKCYPENKPASHANNGLGCQWHHWLEGGAREGFPESVTQEVRPGWGGRIRLQCCWQREWPVQRPCCGNKLNDGAWGQSWPVRTEEGWVTWGLLGVWILQWGPAGRLGELVGWSPQVQ